MAYKVAIAMDEDGTFMAECKPPWMHFTGKNKSRGSQNIKDAIKDTLKA